MFETWHYAMFPFHALSFMLGAHQGWAGRHMNGLSAWGGGMQRCVPTHNGFTMATSPWWVAGLIQDARSALTIRLSVWARSAIDVMQPFSHHKPIQLLQAHQPISLSCTTSMRPAANQFAEPHCQRKTIYSALIFLSSFLLPQSVR